MAYGYANQPVYSGQRVPTFQELVDYWNAGHQGQTGKPPVDGALLWATAEQAAAYEPPQGTPVVLFIQGTNEIHVKSRDNLGAPRTTILDYKERPVEDNSPYATKQQLAQLQESVQAILNVISGGTNQPPTQEASVNQEA